MVTKFIWLFSFFKKRAKKIKKEIERVREVQDARREKELAVIKTTKNKELAALVKQKELANVQWYAD